jgi:hypothetical protein
MHVAWFHRCAFLRAACAGTYLASVINFNQRIGAMAKSNLAVIVGSNRRDSINRKLAHALASSAPAASTRISRASTICRCSTRTSKATCP